MSIHRAKQITMTLRIPAASIRHRKEFILANKNGDETMSNWYKRLQELAEPCEYGSYSEALILQQFICGLDVFLFEHLVAEQRDLSLIDVFNLIEIYERSHEHEEVDVKPTLLSIKQEEPVSSDGEHGEPFNDNTLSDSDGEGHETADAGHQVAVNTTKYEENEANDDGKKDNILAMVPFMAETVIEPPPAASNMFECYLCHKTWKSAGNLTYHFTCYHTVGKTSGCTICGKWIINPSNMVRHLNMHFSTKPYQCNLCDFSYSRSTSLKRHLLSHSRAGTSSYKCSKCSHVFISKKHLKIHKKTHNEPTVSLGEKMDEIVKKRKAKKPKADGTENELKCEICSMPFEEKDSLNAHMKSHWETDWLCHLCGKKLMNKRNLIHHYRTHTNEKPFTCGDCDRAFSSKEKLKLHSKTHSGTRAHICTHCNKSFIQKGHLAKHMKVHFPDTKIKCDHQGCRKEFTKLESYHKHLLVHAEIKLECAFCQKPFKSNSHRVEHERTHTGERPYKCTLCEKSFGQKATLRGHLKWHAKPKLPKGERPKRKRKQKIDGSMGFSLVQATSAYLH